MWSPSRMDVVETQETTGNKNLASLPGSVLVLFRRLNSEIYFKYDHQIFLAQVRQNRLVTSLTETINWND